jgi:hypothetical protein
MCHITDDQGQLRWKGKEILDGWKNYPQKLKHKHRKKQIKRMESMKNYEISCG